MLTMPKSSGVDLTDSECAALLDENVKAMELQPKKMFEYERGKPDDWKRGVHWGGIKKNRTMISDLLEVTKGRMVKQKK